MNVAPEGYKLNARGHFVPQETIDPVDQLEDDLVTNLSAKALDITAILAEYKHNMVTDIQAYLDLIFEKYKAERGGEKGNLKLRSFDGKYLIIREVSERIDFDARIMAAKALVDECLREWTKFAGAEVRSLIEEAFQVDKRGKINTQRILGLRKIKIDHPTWNNAMTAINDALNITGSCIYYRVYERDEQGKYHQIILDLARV